MINEAAKIIHICSIDLRGEIENKYLKLMKEKKKKKRIIIVLEIVLLFLEIKKPSAG